MKAQLFILDPALLELTIVIPDGSGSLKGGKDLLTMEIESSLLISWHEFQPVLVMVDRIEILAKVRSYRELYPRVSELTFYEVKAQKVSIKQRPILGLAYNKDKDETTVSDPEDWPDPELTEIEERLAAAVFTELPNLLSLE